MTASYHERSNAAPVPGRGARGFVALGFALALGGCSISMPMSGFLGEPPSNAPAAKPASDVLPDAHLEKPAVEVAAAPG